MFLSIKRSPNLLSKQVKNSSPQEGLKVMTPSKSTITSSSFFISFKDGPKAAKDSLPNCQLFKVVPNFLKKIIINLKSN